MSSDLTNYVDGWIQMLVNANIGDYAATGEYTADQVGITVQAVPEFPDNIIALTPYTVSDDPLLNDSILAMQIRLRGDRDPRTLIDRDAAIFDLFQGLESVTIGGMHVVLIWRQSELSLPRDANQRWERTSNYYARVNRPTQHRPD